MYAVSGNTVILVTSEQPQTFTFKVHKFNKTTLEALADAEFKVINRSDNAVTVNGHSFAKGAEITGLTFGYSNGVYTISQKLPNGTYGIVETKAPTGYKLDSAEKSVTLDQARTVEFPNEELPVSLIIVKEVERGEVADKDMTFYFKVEGPNGYEAEVSITIPKGQAIGSATLDNLFAGSYTVTEKSTGDGANYTRPASQTKEVKAGEETTFSFTGTNGNKIPRGSITIEKEIKPGDVAMNADVTFTFTVTGTYALGGSYSGNVSITIPKGQKTASKTISNLPYGSYTVTEAPNTNWNISGAQTKTLDKDHTSQTFGFTGTNANSPKLGSLTITKEVEKGEVSDQDRTFNFTVTGRYALGGSYSKNVSIIVKKGQTTASTTLSDLPYGTYTVTEATNANYNIHGPKTADLKDGSTSASFNFTGNDKNTIKRGSLTITKEIETEDYLPDADHTFKFNVIGTYALGGSYSKVVTITVKAGETVASASLSDLPYGTYTVSEQKNDYYKVVGDKAATLKDGANTASFNFTANDKNMLERGDAKLTKVDIDYPDSKLTGAAFDIYNADTNKKVGSMTETSEGVYELKDIPYGNYYAVETKAPQYYVPTDKHFEFKLTPEAPNAEITDGKQSFKCVSNEPQVGEIEIVKTVEDTAELNYDVDEMDLSGFEFRIQGTTKTGFDYDETFRTDREGKIHVSGLRIGTYTVTELANGKTTPFVIPEEQEDEVKTDEITWYRFTNIFKKWNLTVTKIDSEGIERSYAKLTGAVYGIYKNGELVDEYTTDSEGKFTTDYYICDDDWTLAEITPSEGYLLNEDVVDLGTEATLYTVNIELNTAEDEVSPEDVIKGTISLIKHTDEGITKIETPEDGAEFEVYIKSAGSYADASDEERDLLVTDENGFAETKELPYGVYVVHQTKSWPGRELMDDYEVYISKDGMRDFKLINNANFYAYVKVMKKDAETEETIPYAGAKFQIFYTDGDLAGEKVAIEVTYPEHIVIDTFQTNSKGEFITPVELPYGKYELVEVEAPYGYVLDPTPVPFEVTEEQAEQEATIEVIKVTKLNTAQMGKITVTKTGEVFSSVAEESGFYVPKYAEGKLSGAEFTVKAAEDIVTPDRSVRVTKGEVVAVITTGEDGTATTPALYLGKYTVEETQAPYGMLLNKKVHDVELTYAGQEVDVTSAADSFTNEREKFTLEIRKEMQADEDGNIDLDAALKNVVFSLYAREEMVAADGLSSEGTKTIPVDGLLAQASPDTDGKISFNVDLPVDAKVYTKETATDSHFILDTDEYDLSADYAGQDTALVELKFNDGEPVTNIPVEIRTTLESDENHALDDTRKVAVIYGDVKLVDTVTYEGLVPGKAYIMTGILMDKATGEEWKVDGETVTASEVFTPTEANGTVDITFTFKGIAVKEVTSVVAFETLYEKESGAEVAVHTDIEDEDQTVELVEPKIGTTALIDGKKVVGATETFDLVDTVSYENLVPGKEYVLNAKLMDKNTSEVFREITVSHSFTVEEANGTVDVTIPVDVLGLTENTDLVVFETLYIRLEGEEGNTEEVLVTDHEDLDDEGQTVTVEVPEIHTNATVDDGKRETVSVDIHEIVDEVSYKGLTVGKEYVVSGTLMDKDTGKPILIDGKKVTAETTFTAEKSEGTVKVTFHVDLTGLETDAIVVFEDLYRNDVKIAIHADIEDENQTIIVDHPEIGTVAQIDDMKTVGATETFELVDTVAYKNLNPGAEYTVRGILMDAATGEAFLVDGKEVTAEATFTAAEKDGTVDVTFTLSTVGLTKETKLVAFEQLFIVKSAMEGEEIEETLVTEHEDITDEDQTVTVTVPEIRTTALVDGKKKTAAVTTRQIVDTVMYSGLTPGREYTLSGVLMERVPGELGATGEAFLVDGKEITASTTFTAENADGTVDVIFEVDLNGLELETTLVVFETLYRNEIEIAIHADIDDEDQSDLVKIPEIRTSASIDGMKTVGATETFDLVDTVSYKNLLPGMTYIVRGKLMDKSTGKPLLINGKEVTGETVFEAKTTDGTEKVVFKLNALSFLEETNALTEELRSENRTKELVVFEKLYVVEGELVCFVTFHEDIEDEDQTVKVTIPEIGTTATVDGEHETDAIGVVKLKDVVEYKGLTVGKEYTVSGILMDKATGEAFLIDGKEVTATRTFTAKTADGSEELTFEMDLSNVKTNIVTVAFETLLREDVEIAVHADIEDEDQTVVVYPVPVMHTTVSANGKESTDEKAVEIIQVSDKTTVSVKDTIYYECFAGGTYLLEGKLVKIEDGKAPVIIAEASAIVTAEEYKAGTWVLDFGEQKLEVGKYVVFEKATPVTVEEKDNPEKPGEKIQVPTPTGDKPITHENPDDVSQTFVITENPPTGDTVRPIIFSFTAIIVSIAGLIALIRMKRSKKL
ncbi:MAG: VaFE repeat-containing surface-anchored protein [Firmicutes bacterium]|nr:VaFE repeat-containing surface-anchored protein [Bacillota bacterium]